MNRSSINTATRKTIISLFLAFILIAGTITTASVYGQPSNLPFVTKSELQAALANVTTDEELQAALDNAVCQECLEFYLGFAGETTETNPKIVKKVSV